MEMFLIWLLGQEMYVQVIVFCVLGALVFMPQWAALTPWTWDDQLGRVVERHAPMLKKVLKAVFDILSGNYKNAKNR